MTYEEKYDRLNRLVGRIEGTLLYWQSISEPMPLTSINELIEMIEETDKQERVQ